MPIEQEWMLDYMKLSDAFLLWLLLIIAPDEDLSLSIALSYIYFELADTFGPVVYSMWSVLEWAVVLLVVHGIVTRLRIKSDNHYENMRFAFYMGDNTPFFARIASLIGLPARSIAPVLRNQAMVPTGDGYIKCVDIRTLSKNWVIISTPWKVTDLYEHYFFDLNGTQVSKLGCVKACKHLLQEARVKLGFTPGGTMKNVLER